MMNKSGNFLAQSYILPKTGQSIPTIKQKMHHAKCRQPASQNYHIRCSLPNFQPSYATSTTQPQSGYNYASAQSRSYIAPGQYVRGQNIQTLSTGSRYISITTPASTPGVQGGFVQPAVQTGYFSSGTQDRIVQSVSHPISTYPTPTIQGGLSLPVTTARVVSSGVKSRTPLANFQSVKSISPQFVTSGIQNRTSYPISTEFTTTSGIQGGQYQFYKSSGFTSLYGTANKFPMSQSWYRPACTKEKHKEKHDEAAKNEHMEGHKKKTP